MDRVHPQFSPFIIGQFLVFFEDGRRDMDLAYVVQCGLDADGLHKVIGQVELPGKECAIIADPQDMIPGILVIGL